MVIHFINYFYNKPAIVAVRKLAKFPLITALKATSLISPLLSGATLINAPTYIPTAAIDPNPQHA